MVSVAIDAPCTTADVQATAPSAIEFTAGAVSLEWVQSVQTTLEWASRQGIDALQQVLPQETACHILEALEARLKHEKPLVEINPSSPSTTVTVVGDTHGQYHDVCKMLGLAGPPSAEKLFVFNGDYVDRGAWGMETLIILSCWKLLLPDHVTLLRGNHESTTCTTMYGFRAELQAKYQGTDVKALYSACKRVFAALPLAALIARATLVLHGGLFRKPLPKKQKKRKRMPWCMTVNKSSLGSLDDLRSASKGGMDPNGFGSSMLATDVLWSDPVMHPGLEINEVRGVGLVFGPDITEKFLQDNGLSLIIRSHEGPDARDRRDDLPQMMEGYSEDHTTHSGKLVTVFSAPDYPQFVLDESERMNNLAAVLVLTAPHYTSYEVLQYDSVKPRPKADAFYDINEVYGSDEEIELGGAESQMSTASALSGREEPGDTCDTEVQQQQQQLDTPSLLMAEKKKKARCDSGAEAGEPIGEPGDVGDISAPSSHQRRL